MSNTYTLGHLHGTLNRAIVIEKSSQHLECYVPSISNNTVLCISIILDYPMPIEDINYLLYCVDRINNVDDCLEEQEVENKMRKLLTHANQRYYNVYVRVLKNVWEFTAGELYGN
jgi:hypothetical protein